MFMLGMLSKNLFSSSRIHPKSLFSLCRKSQIHSACGKFNSTLLAKVPRRSIPVRHFFGIFKRPKKDQLKIIDNVPDEYKLIYRNSMDTYILLVQLITTVSTLLIVAITVIKNDFNTNNSIYPLEEDQPQATDNEIFYYMTAFVSFVVILQVLVYKLPMRIYYLSQQKTYTFIFFGSYPTTRRKLTCKIGEVIKLPDTGNFLWYKNMRYQIKDQQNIILGEDSFRRPADLYIMLGVQRDPEHEIPK